jgi:hypothetical protein
MSLWALKEVFLELKALGAFSSGLGLNSFESCYFTKNQFKGNYLEVIGI